MWIKLKVLNVLMGVFIGFEGGLMLIQLKGPIRVKGSIYKFGKRTGVDKIKGPKRVNGRIYRLGKPLLEIMKEFARESQ